MRHIRLLILVGLVCTLTLPVQPASGESPEETAASSEIRVVIFSPDLSVGNEKEAAAVIDPYIEHLNEKFDRKHTYEIFFETDSFRAHIQKNRPHFAIINTWSYLRYRKELGLELLCQAEDEGGSSLQQFRFFSRRDMPLKTLRDLVGKRVAVAGFTQRSLQHHWPLLTKDTEYEELQFDDIEFVSTQMPEAAAQAVTDGRTVAGVATDANFDALLDVNPDTAQSITPFFSSRPIPTYTVVTAFRDRVNDQLVELYAGEISHMNEVPPGQMALLVLGAYNFTEVRSHRELLERINRASSLRRASSR